MIVNFTESPRGREFVPKHLSMILNLVLKSWQIVSGISRDMCKLAKKLFETYVPAASTLTKYLVDVGIMSLNVLIA